MTSIQEPVVYTTLFEIEESIAIVAGIDSVNNDVFKSKQTIELLWIPNYRFNLDTVVINNEMIELLYVDS